MDFTIESGWALWPGYGVGLVLTRLLIKDGGMDKIWAGLHSPGCKVTASALPDSKNIPFWQYDTLTELKQIRFIVNCEIMETIRLFVPFAVAVGEDDFVDWPFG